MPEHQNKTSGIPDKRNLSIEMYLIASFLIYTYWNLRSYVLKETGTANTY